MFDSILQLTAVLFFACSFFTYKKGQISFSLLLIVLGGMLLRISVSTDPYLHVWDERYHALVGKNLIHHPLVPTLYENTVLPLDDRFWTASHVWLHKQPLPLWAIALSLKLFGISAFAVRIPSILLSTLSIYLTFRICKNLFQSEKTALLASFFHAINGLIIEITGGRVATDHIDLFFLFFIETGVFFATCYLNRRSLFYCCLTGISLGLAVLCKWLPAFILIPIWGVLAFDGKNLLHFALHLFLILFCAVCIFLPWQLYIRETFPSQAQWESQFNLRHITEVLDNQSGGPFYYFEKLTTVFHEFLVFILGWYVYQWIRKMLKPGHLALLLWILLPVLFFSFVMTKMQGYILFTGPACFMLVALFVSDFSANLSKQRTIRYIRITVIALAFLFPIRYSFERLKPFEGKDSEALAVIDGIKRICAEHHSPNTLFFNDPHYIETLFFTNFTSYERRPSAEEKAFLEKKGYTVITLPDERR